MRQLILIGLIQLVFVDCSTNKELTKNRPSRKIESLKFTADNNVETKFIYSDTVNNEFLRQLRTENNLIHLTKNCKTDLEKLKAITNWTNSQWKHNGDNQPTKSDALTILKEAKEGKQFRCVEYGVVLTSALSSIGIKSRVVALKTRDVESVKYGAGHVLTEAYLMDINKWVMADGQFNIIPSLNNVPLNCIEFQNSIINNENFDLVDKDGVVDKKRKNQYLGFIPQYLYYFDIRFDNRQGPIKDRLTVDGKTKLMLTPLGSKSPTIFQVTGKIDYCLYTNSTNNFYRRP
jgi:hypothetical protein